ncbi:MAG: DNA-binding response regulator [Nitriliruptor sp.]|nr:MAG: DNA-binding response regulator [Nitriliruptor sp.]
MPIRLVIAEDSYLIREGLVVLLADDPDLEVVAAVASMPELDATVAGHGPDVVLTDIRMPPTGTDEGIRAAEQFAATSPGIGVVVLSQHVEPEYALRLFDGGATGRAYLLKERVGDLRQLKQAIAEAARGGSVLDPQVIDVLVDARRRRSTSLLDRLTERESEILGLVAQGGSNQAIATQLSLSGRAVEKHITSILTKLDLPADDGDVHRRVRAVLLYLSETSG